MKMLQVSGMSVKQIHLWASLNLLEKRFWSVGRYLVFGFFWRAAFISSFTKASA